MSQIDFDVHELINEINASGGAYHKMTFPDGTVLNGTFDMSKYLSYYNLPDDLSGKTVLEAGTANGYFAIELYKLGPKKVTAIDFRTGKLQQGANYLMKTNVEFVAKDILKIDESFGKFDLVFCSHVLQHISSPLDAIRKLRLVTKEKAIICTSYLDNHPELEDLPISYFIGEEKSGKKEGTYWVYQRMNRKCLRRMLEAAKFRRIEEVNTFQSISEDGSMKIPSVVFHCYV